MRARRRVHAAPGTDRRISVVVPCYNRAAYLDVLLRSMTWSRVAPTEYEVIVVNDGGVDHVGLVVDAWRRRGLDVTLLAIRECGVPRNNAVARNAGLRAARYPLIVQTDPDIVWASDVLQHVRETLEPGVFCSVNAYYPLTREATLDVALGPDGPSSDPGRYLAHTVGRPNQVLSPDGVGGLHGGFAFYKDDVRQAGGYDESFVHWGWEDRELLVTLEHDLGLTRRWMAETPVVHLWHPTLRGQTRRWELAAEGHVSRVAWDVQMQRALAEYPRSRRPQAPGDVPSDQLAPLATHEAGTSSATESRSPVLDSSAYADWCRSAGIASDPAGPEPFGGPVPLPYQLFFDAARLEAAQLRSMGCATLARELLVQALDRPWERLPLERSRYARVAEALDELAACHDEAGDAEGFAATVRAIAAEPGGASLASACRARHALRRSNLDAARLELAHLRGTAWDALRAAYAIEIALRVEQPGMARDVFATCMTDPRARGDYFEQLRWAAYGRLLDRVAPRSSRAGWRASVLMPAAYEETSEFLYSAALRSLRQGLDLAGCVLLQRFFSCQSPAEPRLVDEGRQHVLAARTRLGVVTTLLDALPPELEEDRVAS